MKRLLFSMAALAVWLVPAHAGTILWDRGPGPGGWLRGTDANAYGQAGGTWADSVLFEEDATITGYVHYSNTYSTDPGFYRMRIFSDGGTYFWGMSRPWALTDELILTATSVDYLGQYGDYYHPEFSPAYKITFAFDPIVLPATTVVPWPNPDGFLVVQAAYYFGLTSASTGTDAGQWFLADGPHGGVALINDSGGEGTYFGGTYAAGQQAFQLLGTVDPGTGGSVPEPATVSVVALGLVFVAGLRRAVCRAGALR